MPDTIPRKPVTVHCGFSLYPRHKAMLEALRAHHDMPRSTILQNLIEQEYNKLNRSEQNA